MRRHGALPPLSSRREQFRVPDMSHVPIQWISSGKSWVVISKPSELLSVPGKSSDASDCALARVAERYPEVNKSGGVVHRLDLPTSGLMVFALTSTGLSELNAQFAKREVSKRYTAVLTRSPSGDKGEVHLPLRLDPFQRPLQIHDPVHGRYCHTRWQKVGTHPKGVVVHLEPVTGRTHQLRLHAAHPLGLNAPIVGDPHYSCDARADGGRPRGVRLHLHASKLVFTDPDTGERVELEDPAPFC